MAEIENVIKAWNCCNPFDRKCKECPYEKDCYHDGISRHMVADAIELLKEQEAVVRCMECMYATVAPDDNGYFYCKYPFASEAPHESHFYCANGVRKEGDGK